MAKHFSHIHNLHEFEVKQRQPDDEDYYYYYFNEELDCSCCESKIPLGSSAYKCPENDCRFYLHKQCFDLPRRVPHKSHPHQALELVPIPPNTYQHFLCEACSLPGTGFKYRCPDPGCDFDLHTKCCHLADVLVSRGHEHPLTLACSTANNEVEGREELRCGVCRSDFPDWLWGYFCKECGNYGEHVGCEFVIEEDYDQEREEKEEQEEVVKEKEEEIEEEEGEEEKEEEEEEEEEEDEEEGDDEIITIRRGELRKLYGLLARKDAVIATYQMSNMRLQHRQLLSTNRNLYGFHYL